MLVSLENQRCPICGKVVRDQKSISISGHIRGIEMGKTSFACCREHRKEAESALKRKAKNDCDGYLGEWEERLGLVAEIQRNDDTHEVVTIIEGSGLLPKEPPARPYAAPAPIDTGDGSF